MKDEGRSEKELAECYAFILCKEKLQVALALSFFCNFI